MKKNSARGRSLDGLAKYFGADVPALADYAVGRESIYKEERLFKTR
jgi:hypothetical protein